jgi:hypothetical protein
MNDEICKVLRKQWDIGEPESTNKYRAIFTSHRQEWFLGWTAEGRKELVLATKMSAKLSDSVSSQSISLQETKIASNKYLLYFILIDESVYEVYLKLCEDLIEQLESVEDSNIALKIVLERFRLWKNMLGKKNVSDEVYKGLLGELLMIRELIKQGDNPSDVMKAWTGPEYTEQDFVFAEKWYEVKAVSSGAMIVKISSAGQLDHPGKGVLSVFFLDKEHTPSDVLISVKTITSELKTNWLSNDPEALSIFEEKLFQFEYLVFCLEDTFWFNFIHVIQYRIEDEFPMLTHAMKRSEMQSVKYSLTLAALEPWRL